ncbi:transcriptional regulator [Nocardioides humilatus]|uniref:Transcriptional regulator n=1 Tax=Nocardioides humilatus TaxID=2607660 RepID=A0A5B1LKZ0_9ACTN|nr:winged helix-turn-helix transcriptional regulator [Nocardioides humilatus]KAA1421233.1 transcriptional regulator [Nocardioides humilatus]
MGTKSYEQYCTIATALDLVGDRWSLLILRELSFGEQRFTDLKAGLPGVATNLLTMRLRSLEEDGLVEQHELPPPAARTVYRLTKAGTRIRPVLRAVAQFGLPYLDPPAAADVRPRMVVYGGVGALFDPVSALGVDLRVKFDLDGEEHWVEVRDGKLRRADTSLPPDLTITGPAAALLERARGASLDALSDELAIEGSQEARQAFERCFPRPADLAWPHGDARSP